MPYGLVEKLRKANMHAFDNAKQELLQDILFYEIIVCSSCTYSGLAQVYSTAPWQRMAIAIL